MQLQKKVRTKTKHPVYFLTAILQFVSQQLILSGSFIENVYMTERVTKTACYIEYFHNNNRNYQQGSYIINAFFACFVILETESEQK